MTFAQRCVAQGWGGMEFLIGIPGTIGGAVAMNAGAHGGETADFLQEAEWMDMEGNLHTSARQNLEFRYRYSDLMGNYGRIITSAVFEFQESDPETVEKNCLNVNSSAWKNNLTINQAVVQSSKILLEILLPA